MNELICYKIMPEWNASNIPKGFKAKHNTKVGTWGKLRVIAGKLKYYALDESGVTTDTAVFDSASDIPFIQPQAWHKIEPISDDLRCQLSFYCQPQDYYHKKYQLSKTHSAALQALRYIQSGKALDVGCGRGRNALYLQQQGFEVTAFDKNASAIDVLQDIIETEKLERLNAFTADINNPSLYAHLDNDYDLIISTVVLMFLSAQDIPTVIHNLQGRTAIGGYNVIVSAIDSDDYPMSAHALPFTFGFKPNALKHYYNDWAIAHYDENVGQLHRKDANGNPIALRFATLIARKQ